MPLFSKADAGELILILDVQSSVVRGSLAVVSDTANPAVIFTYNAVISYKPHTDATYLIKMTLRAVDETVEAVTRAMNIRRSQKQSDPSVPQKISAVHYALSSPWIVSQAKEYSTQFPKPTRITYSYISDLIAAERKKLMTGSTEPMEVIEEKVFDVRLNGYSIPTWEGRETNDLQVAFADSIAGSRMIERFRDCVKHIARGHNVYFHSSLMLQYVGIGVVRPDLDNFSLLHIHGELTDLAVIREKSCAFFGSTLFGVRTLVRKIAAAMGTDLQAADSLLSLYTGGHLDETHGKDALVVVATIAEGWQNDLRKLFASTGLEIQPPLAIMLSAWVHDDFFAKILKQTYAKIRVDILSIEDVAKWVSFRERVERRRLTGLYAVAIHTMR